MRLTGAIRKAVRAECAKACGGRRTVEPGEWWFRQADGSDKATYNHLFDTDVDGDLIESTDLGVMGGTDIDTVDGWVMLDCYCYYPPYKRDGELDDNVAVLISPEGVVVYAEPVGRHSMAKVRQVMAAWTGKAAERVSCG